MSHVEEIVFEPGDGTGDEFVGRSLVEDKKHSLHGLTQYAEGQRIHPGIPRDFLGTFDGWDYIQSIKDNARARQYEWIMVELRLSGRVHGSPKTVHLKPRVETVDLTLPPGHTSASPYSYPSRVYSRSRYSKQRPPRRERVREGVSKDQLFIQTLERERQQARETLERERQHAAELRALERGALDEKLVRFEQQLAGNPAPQADPDVLLLKAVVNRSSFIDDALDGLISAAQSEENESWYAEPARSAVHALAPAVGSLVGSFAQRLVAPLVNGQQADAAQPPPVTGVQAHAPTPQPTHNSQQQSPLSDEAQAAFAQMLAVVVQDMTANAPAERSVEAVLALCAKHPEVRMAVDPLLSQPAPAVVATLAQIGGAPVAQACAVPHARAFIEKLQAGINARRQPPQEKPSAVAVSSNGARAAQSS